MHKRKFNWTNFFLIIFVSTLGIVILMLVSIIPSPLTFFSQQKEKKTQSNTPVSTAPSKKIISPNAPQTFTNTKTKGLQTVIKNSQITVTKPVTLKVSIKIKTENKDKKATNGILFTNDTSNSLAKPDQVNSLYLFYYHPHNTWVLRYRYQKTNKFYTISTPPADSISGDFTILITNDGKTVKVNSPSGEKTIQLPTFLYTITNRMVAKVQIEPQSTVEISSLTYQ